MIRLSHTRIQCSDIFVFWPPPGHALVGDMVGEARGWPMHTRSGRCSIFAMRTASDYLPRVARPPRSGSSAHSAIADIPLWSSSPL